MKAKCHYLVIVHGLIALVFSLVFNQQARADFIFTGSLNTNRYGATATLLLNGKVLVAGGRNTNAYLNGYLSSAELYDPASGTWTNTGSLATPRMDHTATLLPNGQVLVASGANSGGDLFSAELYNPATGTWTNTGALSIARIGYTATLLPNGKVLAAGGNAAGGFVASAELYDPVAGTWANTGSMAASRETHTATLLTNGQVLVTGGDNNSGFISSAELYDPLAGTWTNTSSMAIPHGSHTATLLSNGQVLVAGGANSSGPLSSAELYDPVAGTWTNTSSMLYTHYGHTATLLPDGEVLVAAGQGTNGTPSSDAELYDSVSGTWNETTSPLNIARILDTATLLTNGQVLVVGGETNFVGLGSAEIYTDMGTLKVLLGPPNAVSAGAQWQVDGGAWQNSGATVTNLLAGPHTISFNTITGWVTPSNVVLTISSGINIVFSARDYDYIGIGAMQVTIEPSSAVVDGAQWQVDGGAFQNSGTVLTNLPVGNHTVAFTTVAGWFTPASQTVTINSGVTTNISTTYVPNIGALQVAIEPACAVVGGAQWQVDGGAWQASGAVVTNLAGGNHTVSFSSIVGWNTPSSQMVVVSANVTNTAIGDYIEGSTPGAITWINVGGANANWSTSTNWDLDRAPTTNDVVLIPYTGGNTCIMDVDATVAGLVLGACDGVGSDGLYLNGHTLTVNGAITIKSNAVFGVNSGTLMGGSNTIISGVIGWTSGTLGGTLTLASNCVLNISATTFNKNFTGCILTNHGTVNWSADQLNGGGGVVIDNYGFWNAQDDQTFGGPNAVFNNYGTFRKSGGTGSYPGTFFYNGAVFNQLAGVIDVQNGTNGLELNLQGGGSFTGGYFTTNSTGLSFLGAGNFNICGTTTSTNVVMGGTYLVGTNVINGGLTWQNGSWNNAVVTVAKNTVLTIDATTYSKDISGSIFTNYGTVNWSQDQLNGDGGTVIYNYGVWNAQDSQYFDGGSGTTFNNYGIFRKTGGTAGYPGTFFNGTVFNQAGGVLSVQTNIVTLGGTYSLTNGTLNFGINGVANNGVLLAGSVTLGGSLTVNVSGSFAPAIGNQFGVIGSTALSGTFSSVNLPAGFSVAYTNNGVVLNVTGPVPVQILDPQPVGTNFMFQFPTASSQSYTIQQNNNLATTNWVYYTNITGSGSVFQFQTPVTPTPTQRYFRVRQP